LQAFARSRGLDKFQIRNKFAKVRLEQAASRENEHFLVSSRLNVFEHLSQEITKLEATLRKEANRDKKAKLLLTHSGIGSLTALAVVHTLGDVNRFRRKQEIVAFIGLDPLDQSSGERKRIGRISKHGSRLVRFLLVQAANTTRDNRLKEFYQQVSRRRGKPKAKIAVARKLLINCYIMLRDEIDYQEFSRRGEVDLCG
jgi:transposase